MCPATESGRSESGPFVIDDYFLTVFIRRAPVERIQPHRNRNASVPKAQTYGCKILQLYEYSDANVLQIRCELRMRPQEYQFMQHKRQLIAGLRYFCISLNMTCFKIKIITINIMFFMKVRPLIGRRIGIGRRLQAYAKLSAFEYENTES